MLESLQVTSTTRQWLACRTSLELYYYNKFDSDCRTAATPSHGPPASRLGEPAWEPAARDGPRAAGRRAGAHVLAGVHRPTQRWGQSVSGLWLPGLPRLAWLSCRVHGMPHQVAHFSRHMARCNNTGNPSSDWQNQGMHRALQRIILRRCPNLPADLKRQ